MVRVNFEDFDEHYEAIRISACGHQACSVLIMVALEVDAMSSARMLSQLLRGDNVAYLIRPVGNFTEVEAAFSSNITSDIKTVFMINCGAIYDIPKAFSLEQGGDVRVFILDNHRPVHLKNIYSRHNVVVFDDNYDANNLQDNDDVPSEASEMSSVKDGEEDDDDLDSKSSTPTEDQDDEEEEEDYDNQEGQEEEQEEEFEMDVDADNNHLDAEATEETGLAEEKANDDADETVSATKANKDLPVQPPEAQDQAESGGEDIDQTFVGAWPAQQPEEGEAEADITVDQIDPADSDDEKIGDDEEDLMHDEDDPQEEEEEEENIKMASKKRKLFSSSTTDPHKAKRLRIKAYYFQPISYSSPTSLMLLKHVQQRFAANGQMPLDVSWQTILGVTDMFMKGRLTEQQYEECCHHLKIQLGDRLHSLDRLSYTTAAATTTTADQQLGAGGAAAVITINGAQAGQIKETSEYRFFLHRHWSLYESMFHSVYIASRFPVWNTRGLSKLQELLAEMGISLSQCKQSYSFMSPELRQHFRDMINLPSLQEKYGLKDTTAMYKSFVRYAGYKMPLAAEDVVQSTTALLELYSNKMVTEDMLVNQLIDHGGKENVPPAGSHEAHYSATKEEKNTFFSAYELLGGRNDKLIKEGITIALDIQRAIVKKASAMLEDTNGIVPFHRIYYAYLHNHFGGKQISNDGKKAVSGQEMELIFGRPMVLTRLGQFIMEVKRKLPKSEKPWTGLNLLPLILLSERQDGSYLVVGISPLSTAMGTEGISEEMQEKLAPLVNFRQFFKLAAKDMNIKFRSNSFDPNVVEIDKEDTQDFLGALNNVLKKATPNFKSRQGDRA